MLEPPDLAIDRIVAAVRAHSAPTDVSAAIRTIDAARRVDANDYSEAVTAVLEAGRVRLRTAVTIPGAPGSGSAGLRLAAGEELRVLATADGFTTFVYGGRVYEARLEGAETLQAPVVEVWVRLLPREQQAAAHHGRGDAPRHRQEDENREVLGQQRLGHVCSALRGATTTMAGPWRAVPQPMPQRSAAGH